MLPHGALWQRRVKQKAEYSGEKSRSNRLFVCSKSSKMKKFILIILMTFICLAACRLDTGEDTRAVKDTILRYNRLLAEGYAKTDMTPLQKVATQEQAEKVYNHMAALGEAKIRMESELVDIDFLDVKLSEENVVQVKTRETWNYTHVNIDTKMPGQAIAEGLDLCTVI